MSRDKTYGNWEERISANARPFGWRDVAWIVAKGVLVGLLVVAVTRGF